MLQSKTNRRISISPLFITSFLFASFFLLSFSIEDKIKELEILLAEGSAETQYEAARKLAAIYRDSLYNYKKEGVYLKKAIALIPDTASISESTKLQLYLGRSYLNITAYDSAMQVFTQLRELEHVKQDTLLDLEIGEYAANTLQQQNKLPEALATYLDLIIRYQQLGTFEGSYIACLNSINAAYVQILQKNYRESITLLSYCYDIEPSSEEQAKELRDLSVNYDWLMALSFENLSILDTASLYYQKTLETSRSINYPFTEAYALLGLGGYEVDAHQNYNKAKGLLEQALEIFRSIDYIEGEIPSLNRLSLSTNKLGNTRIAEKYALEAVRLAEEINSHEGLKDGYENLSEIASDLGQSTKALSYYKKHAAYKDSILNSERVNEIEKLNVVHKTELKDIEISNLEETTKLQSQRLLFGGLAAGASLLGLLALGNFLITRQRLRQTKATAQYEKEVSTALNKFVPMRFLNALGRDNILEVNLGDQIEQEVTVLFTDIRSFTTISEQMTPIQNFQFVKEYAEEMGPIIVRNGGFINQYLGDGIMAIFQNKPDEALQACVEMQQAVRKFNKDRESDQSFKPIKVGMGLHTGMLVMGIIGDENRQDAALISDTVNTAARLESLTKEYGTKIILSQKTMDKLENKDNFAFRYLGSSKVKGKVETITLYECINGDDQTLRDSKASYIQEFEKSVKLMVNGESATAKQKLSKLHLAHEDDDVLKKLLEKT